MSRFWAVSNLGYSPILKYVDRQHLPAYVLAREEVIEVKSKVLVAVLALAVVLLATPMLGTVMAGKGQTKVSFKLVLVGTYGAPAIEKEVGQSVHILDMPFYALGWSGSEDYPTPYAPLVLEIDGVPIVDPLSYEGMMKVIWSEVPEGKSGGQPNTVIMVDEIITIGEAGTIVLQVKGNNQNAGNGEKAGAGDNFIGFGTDDFEGVKIQGSSPGGPVQVGEMEVAPGVILPISKLERVGTVMGWP